MQVSSMIKNVVAVLLVSMALTSCKHSKNSVKEGIMRGDVIVDNGKSLLWSVLGENMEQPSYIFGTIHIIKNEDFFLGNRIDEIIRNASKIVLEVDLQHINTLELASAGILPDGKQINDYITEEDYEILLSFMADSVGLSKASFNAAYSKMKPMFIEQFVVYRFLGENPRSYELEVSEMAEEEGIEIEGLETLAEQISFIDQIPMEQQISDLMETIKNYSNTRKVFTSLLDYYKTQDLEKLSDLIAKELESNEAYQEILLDKRNKNWLPKIEEYVAEGNVFMAVGAGHLGGEGGVLNLLKAKGYRVEPIEMD